MLARALTTVTRAQQQQQQQPNSLGCTSSQLSASSMRIVNNRGGFDDHLAATDELKNYNQEEDDEDNPDEEGEEAGALRQEDDDEDEAAPAAIIEEGRLLNRLRPRISVAGIDRFFVNADARNLRQDKSELVAEGESAAAAAAAAASAAALWRPFEAAIPPPHPQAVLHHDQQLRDSSCSQSGHRHTPVRRVLQQQQQQQQPKQRIKKPLNAFMLYMRDHRAAVAAEHSLRESAEINRLLGRQWQALSRQEQAKYYQLAQLEKERHCRLHPNWSAKDNYGSCVGNSSGSGANGSGSSVDHLQQHRRQQQQQQQQRRQPIAAAIFDLDGSSNKKCRAIYGLERQDLWCRPCRRKKRCARFVGDNKPGVGVAMETVAHVISE